MGTVALWCTASQAEAELLLHTLRPQLHHPAVSHVLVLHTGSRAPASFGALERLSPKALEVHRPFGVGLDRSVQDGGYDQLSARNHALDLLDQSVAEWLFQVDVDEFVHPQLLEEIGGLAERYDAVCMSYYTLCSPSTYWEERQHRRIVNGVQLHHPRILAWRRSLQKRCDPCPVSRLHHINRTRHASVSFIHHPAWKIYPVHRYPVYHLHCLLGKEHTHWRTAEAPLDHSLPVDLQLTIQHLRQGAANHEFR